jgi:UDP-N-acetylmuramoyl-tripeptide--D-alanyl-D-alanine ligase
MITWSPERLASASGADLLRRPRAGQGPRRAVTDSRLVRPGDLFVGLPGTRTDGGAHAGEALAAGAWGALVDPGHAETLAGLPHADPRRRHALLAHPEPLQALQALAGAWRDELVRDGACVIGITGSTGKTSTKDILAALLRPQLRVCASPANFNTEVGLPLAILRAPHGTQALVLEMAMRGPGQIVELARIARPHIGLIVNIGPVHLELLGSLEAVAAAKAELIESLPDGATAVVPAQEALLEPYLRPGLRTITFGEGGDVALARNFVEGEVLIADRIFTAAPDPPPDAQAGRASGTRWQHRDAAPRDARTIRLCPSFSQAHNLCNLLAAIAAARALGITPRGRLDVRFSALRGERVALPNGVLLINDCYNANPMSMRAAIEDLAACAPGRRVAVLGDMLELGPQEVSLHHELACSARTAGLHLLVTVGPLAAAMREPFLEGQPGGEPPCQAHSVADADAAAALLRRLLRSGDTVLVKGSRGVQLERVAESLQGALARGVG